MNSSQIEEALNTSNEEVKSIVSIILNMNMWNETSEKYIVTSINKLLAVSKSRLQGLEFLNLIINSCSARIISENGITWISHCLVKYPGDNLKEIKLTTIGRVVENSYEEQEFTKKFISEYISKVLEMCLSTHSNCHECNAGLNTLAICMKYYGSWFAPHKLRLENYLTTFLENTSEDTVEKAAIGFHYLQQVGGAGTDGINHKKNFTTNFHKLCATAQILFDKFFENEIEIDHSDRSVQEVFEFVNLPHHTQKMFHVISRRIRNCLTFITTMLLKGFPAEKEIKPNDVLDIINRGTATHRCLSTAQDNSLEDFQFSVLLNQVQIELLRLLHVLIIWLHANALPFSFTITKILIDSLNKSQMCQCFKTNSLYQELVYKVLGCWIRLSRGALHSHFQTELVKCILKDITPVKNSVSLSLPSDVHKNKSKKAVQKTIQEKIISTGLRSNLRQELSNSEKFNREQNCLLALDALKHLLIGTILKLHPNTIQELYTCIINTLIDIQTSETSHPYTNQECEAKLYEVLVAFYEQDTLKVLPPLQLTIEILNRGINNSNRAIALTCEYGLSNLEKICQPVCCSLFTSDTTVGKVPIKESESFIRKKFEERENADKIEQSSNGKELHREPSNASENEVMETVVFERNEKMTDTEESITLEREPSIHIIDMQIITSDNHVGSEQTTGETSAVGAEQIEEHRVYIKTEIDNSSSENHDNDNTDRAESNEPPLKKIRTEGVSDNVLNGVPEKESSKSTIESAENRESTLGENRIEEQLNVVINVKNELFLQNSEDDIFFEGDDFVDSVKDY